MARSVPTTLALAATLALSVAATAIAADPSGAPTSPGRIVYGLHGSDGIDQVRTMAPDGSDDRDLMPGPAYGPRISPDGTRIMVGVPAGDGRDATVIVSTDGTPPIHVPQPEGSTLSLFPGAWSPDGTRIALDAWDPADPSSSGIYLATADGSDLTRLTTGAAPLGATTIAWSPDGTSLLVAAMTQEDGGALHVLPVDGSAPVVLTPAGQHVWVTGFGPVASWSPDSRSVAFAATKDGTSGLSAPFVVGADGSGMLQLDDWSAYDTGARFSPDGAWIVFDHAVGGGEHQLFLIRPDGTGLTQLTTHDTFGAGLCCAAWSPDGSALVFQGGPAGAARLYTIAADGSDPRELGVVPADYSDVAWAPQ